MAMSKEFIKTVLDCIKPGHHVLDLGTGDGRFARLFAERGAHVTAVDPEAPTTAEPLIDFKKMPVEEFMSHADTTPYDMVFMRNFIQFLDKQWCFDILFPWVGTRLRGGGILAIHTFYRDPEPPFDHPMRSLYPINELKEHFVLWPEVLAEEYCERGLDMAGQERTFFVSDLIVQKK